MGHQGLSGASDQQLISSQDPSAQHLTVTARQQKLPERGLFGLVGAFGPSLCLLTACLEFPDCNSHVKFSGTTRIQNKLIESDFGHRFHRPFNSMEGGKGMGCSRKNTVSTVKDVELVRDRLILRSMSIAIIDSTTIPVLRIGRMTPLRQW